METYEKPFDEVMTKLRDALIRNHQVPEFTVKELTANFYKNGVCCIAKHYAMAGSIPLSYETKTWLEMKLIKVAIVKINLYDTLQEYERDKATLLTASVAEIPNLN